MSESSQTLHQANRSPLAEEKIGILGRFWRGRIWYGTEWYITVFGGAVLVVMALITLLAPWISPHDPNDFIGAAFTPPGGGMQSVLSRVGDTPLDGTGSLEGFTIGVQRNKNGTNLAKELDLERVRYQDQDLMLEGLLRGS